MRRVRRAVRKLRWVAKRPLGLPRRILVEIRWRLGDEIMAIPIYEALRLRYPDAHLSVWCNYPELLDENPFVDKVIGPTDAAEPEAHAPIRADARDVPPDRYILLRTAARDAYRLGEYAKHAHIPLPRMRPRLYYRDWSTPLLGGSPLQAGHPLIAVSAGASWPTKRWPIERWPLLAQALEGSGYSVVELGRGCEQIGVGVSLVDKTTVREAACVLHAARLFIGCDSGLMHLALAAGSKALALFGPTDPSILIRDDPNLSVITNDRECSGCWNVSGQPVEAGLAPAAALGACPRNLPSCLDSITVEAVLQRAQRLLAI